MPKQEVVGFFYEYRVSMEIAGKDHPFYALIMAAMRKADSTNTEKLKQAWPEVWEALQARYYAPGGAVTQSELDALAPRLEV